MLSVLSYEQLRTLWDCCTDELDSRDYETYSDRCDCGAGYCPTDNLHYPCVCEPAEDDLPF